MLIVVIIAAILILTLIKPIFQQASFSASRNIEESRQVARGALLGASWLLFRK